ncbi:hypothetical protein RESH_02131 [Rhodopirellula europaea SH398]|uniref:Uncharacterized protein n=1 Tax=Rhodopirellula europaea SH398 TaxID=1263868 RepID=M5S750_9BACT|nr:hypothetical protein RESH_02131 [Rhodopirellula europaea SH398]
MSIHGEEGSQRHAVDTDRCIGTEELSTEAKIGPLDPRVLPRNAASI